MFLYMGFIKGLEDAFRMLPISGTPLQSANSLLRLFLSSILFSTQPIILSKSDFRFYGPVCRRPYWRVRLMIHVFKILVWLPLPWKKSISVLLTIKWRARCLLENVLQLWCYYNTFNWKVISSKGLEFQKMTTCNELFFFWTKKTTIKNESDDTWIR